MAVENTVSSDFLSAFMRGSRGGGGSTLTTFFQVNEGRREDPNTTISGPPTTCQRNATWRFAGGPMVAQHWMLDLYICSFVIFQGIRTSIALETLYFLIFSTGGVQIPCLRWRSSIVKNVFDCRLSGVGGYKQFGRCILVENLKRRWIEITDLISKSISGKKITLFTNINEMTYSRWSWNYRRRERQGPTDKKSSDIFTCILV